MSRVRPPIPRTVWALGLVSLCMDVSSEMIHALLPLYLTASLGASVAFVGLIEGVAESTASIVKVFSGYFSDRFGRRKPLILIGYGLGALSKPLFALAGAPATVLAARFADRIGKGMRGAPRDALVADVTPEEIRGRAYGLRQSLDTVGAFLGPSLALALMATFADEARIVFWFAVIPGALAVALVIFGVEDAAAPKRAIGAPPIRLADLARLPRPFWSVTTIGVAFTLARFSEAFLVLRAHDLGLPIGLAPLTLIVMNIVYSVGAYPAGALSDRTRPTRLLLWSLVALVTADLALAFASGLWAAFAGVALWGVHMALSQGVMAKLVADAAPVALRGSAFGLFNFASGVTMLVASLVAGLLWERIGASASFLAGAGFAAVAATLAVSGARDRAA